MDFFLEIYIGASTYRYSVRGSAATCRDGILRAFGDGLEEPTIDAFSDSDVSISLVPGILDVSALWRAGFSPHSATCRLWLAEDGDDLRDILPVASGNILDPSFGGNDEAFQFAIGTSRVSRGVPPASWVADENTLSDRTSSSLVANEKIIGASYNIVIGGQLGNSLRPIGSQYKFPRGFPVYPTYLDGTGSSVWSSVYHLCGHKVDSTYVTIYCVSDGITLSSGEFLPVTIASGPVSTETDERGNLVSVAYASSSGDFSGLGPADPDAEYWAFFTENIVTWIPPVPLTLAEEGFGAVGDSGPVRGLAEVVQFLYALAGQPLDVDRFALHFQDVNKYLIDWYTASRVDSVSQLVDDMISGLPIVRLRGSGGDYFVEVPTIPDRSKVVAKLRYGNGSGIQVDRTGPVEFPSEPKNEILVRYFQDNGSTYLKTATVGDYRGDTGDTAYHQECAESQARFGKITKEIQLSCTNRSSTAFMAAISQANEIANPKASIPYVAKTEDVYMLSPFSIVEISDDSIGLSGAIARVDGLRYDSATAEIRLTILSTEDE